jgi:hypothetical protein
VLNKPKGNLTAWWTFLHHLYNNSELKAARGAFPPFKTV